MTSDYSVAVPGSIGREKSRPINGVDEKVIYTFAFWAFLSLLFLMPLMLGAAGGLKSLILLTLFLVWWAVFFKYLRSTKHIEKAILFFKYLLRVKRRENFIAKYTQPLKYIASSYPVKDIHEGGLIEYYGPTTPWGVLLEVDPFRVGDDELEAHQAQLVEVFDSLPETIKFSVINTSYVDDSEHIISNIRNRANDPHLSLQQKEHLAYLHYEFSNETVPVIDWKILISLVFDDASNLKEALVKMGEYIPGIVNGLQEAGLNCFVIEDKVEVVNKFRKMMEV
jgi:hypothetical protein